MKEKIYIAGPLFTEGDRWFLEKIDALCNKLGFITYLPHRDAGVCPPSGIGSNSFFLRDLEELNECKIVVAVLNGTDIDSGTSWEIGYAYSKNKKIIGYLDDSRVENPVANLNLMILNSLFLVQSFEKLNELLKSNLD